MEGGSCRAALPSLHIGSMANEMTGLNVIRRPHARKKNQRVMNRRQSTSISGKSPPRARKGRGHTAPSSARRLLKKRGSPLDEALSVFDDRGISFDWTHARRPDDRAGFDIELPAVKIAFDHVAFDEAFRQ